MAEKLRRHPELLEHVRANLARWRSAGTGGSYIEDWQHLIDVGLEAVLTVALEGSERAAAMRRDSPFAGVLTEEERRSFLRSWSR